jgi:hypothetical protein
MRPKQDERRAGDACVDSGGRRAGCARRGGKGTHEGHGRGEHSPPYRRRGVLAAAVSLLACWTADWAAAQQPLRYDLPPGRRLEYNLRTAIYALDSNEPRGGSLEQIEFWSLAKREERLTILAERVAMSVGRTEPTVGGVFWINADNGRRELPPPTRARIASIEGIFDLLPALPLPIEAHGFWATPRDEFGQFWRCRQAPAEGEITAVDFDAEFFQSTVALLGRERSGRFWFDPRLGCVTRFESKQQDKARNTRITVEATLRAVGTEPPSWIQRSGRETDQFLRTLEREDLLEHEICTRPGELTRTLEQMDRTWAALRADLDLRGGSPFLRLVDGRRRQLRGQADMYRARAALAARWLNRPARPWSLQDPDGRTIASETLRRGVVIEVFWSAVDEWGPRTLEAIRALRPAPGRPAVPVLAYNADQNAVLARQAIALYGQGVTNLLAATLLDIEHVPELPIVRVLDRAGVVRGLWIGWQPDFSEVMRTAERLAEN